MNFYMINILLTTYMIMEYVVGEDPERCLGELGCIQEEEEAGLVF